MYGNAYVDRNVRLVHGINFVWVVYQFWIFFPGKFGVLNVCFVSQFSLCIMMRFMLEKIICTKLLRTKVKVEDRLYIYV